MNKLFVGSIVLVGEKGSALPDYLGKITKIGAREVQFKAFRFVDGYYLNNGYVLKYENSFERNILTAPKNLIRKHLINIPKDFEVIVEKI